MGAGTCGQQRLDAPGHPGGVDDRFEAGQAGGVYVRSPPSRATAAVSSMAAKPAAISPSDAGQHIQEVFRGLVTDPERIITVCDDICSAFEEGRNSLVLTRWTEHLEAIVTELTGRGMQPLVLRGGLGKKARRYIVDQLAEPDLRGTVLVATSSFLGEGFDCRPSTPCSWHFRVS